MVSSEVHVFSKKERIVGCGIAKQHIKGMRNLKSIRVHSLVFGVIKSTFPYKVFTRKKWALDVIVVLSELLSYWHQGFAKQVPFCVPAFAICDVIVF